MEGWRRSLIEVDILNRQVKLAVMGRGEWPATAILPISFGGCVGRLRGADGRYHSSGGGTKEVVEDLGVAVSCPGVKQRRRSAEQQIAEALPEIAARFVEQARQGSVPHAKALAALGSLDRARLSGDRRQAQRSRRREQSLTEQLMVELRRGREAEDGASGKA